MSEIFMKGDEAPKIEEERACPFSGCEFGRTYKRDELAIHLNFECGQDNYGREEKGL